MALAAGTRIGHYELLSLAGAGGMGEVYRARDTHLKRDVGIKYFPASLVHDVARLSRFQREAEILASLNHTGIATIHGFVEFSGVNAIVMEFVDGETLAERITQGPLPIETVESYSRQIIGALEYAHDHGITHRDLEPANVKITSDGTLKLLDFGLAKAVEDPNATVNIADSPTLSLGHTGAGTILGTASYMSPEQAVGKPADRRSDVFSFGVVLFEMLTGQRAFTGESGPEILASVVKEQPDWSKLPPETPEPMRNVLRRCLVKDRKQRMQAIAEARIALDTPIVSQSATGPSPSRLSYAGWITAALLAIISAVALWGWLKPVSPEPRSLTHFTTALPKGGDGGRPITLSRDGSRIVFSGRNTKRLYMRTIDDPEAKPLPGTDGAIFSAFSPAGDWIAFNVGLALKKIPVLGGAALTLAEEAGSSPLSWGDDDKILMSGPSGLVRVPGAGGRPETVAAPDRQKGELAYLSAELLPGGRNILVNVLTAKGLADIQLIAINVQTGDKKILLEGVGDTRFAPTGKKPGIGHLVYGRNGSLFGVPFDANTLQAGSPAPIRQGLQGEAGLVVFGFSHSGMLAYAAGTGHGLAPPSTLIWADRQGMEQPVPAPARLYDRPRLSPDGGRIAVESAELTQLQNNDIWVYELARGTLNRVTFEGVNLDPRWCPDGSHLIYVSAADLTGPHEVRSVAADGSSQPVTLWGIDQGPSVHSVSRDGIAIGIAPDTKSKDTQSKGGSQPQVRKVGPDGQPVDGKPENFLDARFVRMNLEFSPDGKWVAYQSNQTGRSEIYVVPYPGPGGISQVSSDGGFDPRWNRNGRELFFRNGNKVMAVDVEPGTAFRAGNPHMLFEKAAGPYDVHPDGRRFLMLKPVPPSNPEDQPNEYHVILNWFDELRRRVPLPE